jgi:small subunit ribosomal protein S2
VTTELIKEFLEAGLHFGHQTKRWNPKMAKFIYGERNGIYIVDLQKTTECLKEAREFLKETASAGGYVLFVGTKRQAQDIVKEEAQRCGMFYVNHRWLGGMLTNFKTIRKSVARLKELEQMQQKGLFDKLSKKEVSSLNQELQRLTKNLSGVVKMDELPQIVFIIDPYREDIAVSEANKLKIPVVALADTNSNPDGLDYPIPGNDDAIRSIKYITKSVTDSIIEGRQEYLQAQELKKTKEEKEEELKKAEDEKTAEEETEEVEELEKKVKAEDIDEKIRRKRKSPEEE